MDSNIKMKNKISYDLPPFKYKINIPANKLNDIDNFIKCFFKTKNISKDYLIISSIEKYEIQEIECFYDQLICTLLIFSKGFLIKEGCRVYGSIYVSIKKQYFLILNKEKMAQVLNENNATYKDGEIREAIICDVSSSKVFHVKII